MEFSSHEDAEIPMPINSAYVGGIHAHHGQMSHHHNNHQDPALPTLIIPTSSSTPHIVPSNNSNGTSTTTTLEDNQHQPYNLAVQKKVIRYRECQKNHAASMGGNATDGCGEFMPSGEEGTLEALTCSACNCHRNFHRKEVEGEQQQQQMIIAHPSHFYPSAPHANLLNSRGRKVLLGSAAGPVIPYTRSVPISMAYQVGGQTTSSVPSDQSDEHDHHHHHGNGGMMVIKPHNHVVKKRFRTKFSQEQKEKMLDFAEKVGWKIQKQEETVVQQFCQELGIKRRVLKVWMHNNKHSLAKKNHMSNTNNSSS